MQVFEIIKPGTWLDGLSREHSWEIKQQLYHLEEQFYEANIALNHFSEVFAFHFASHDQAAWERDRRRSMEIYKEVALEIGGFHDAPSDELQFEAAARSARERWVRDNGPKKFKDAMPTIYARVFLFALDGFDKFLEKLSKDLEKGVPVAVSKWHVEFLRCFPILRDVRTALITTRIDLAVSVKVRKCLTCNQLITA